VTSFLTHSGHDLGRPVCYFPFHYTSRSFCGTDHVFLSCCVLIYLPKCCVYILYITSPPPPTSLLLRVPKAEQAWFSPATSFQILYLIPVFVADSAFCMNCAPIWLFCYSLVSA
jgi:hypothetical protein